MRKIWNKLKNFFALCREVLREMWFVVAYTVERNVYVVAKLIEISTPYIMWYLTISLYEERGYFAVGGEVFVPVALFFVCSVLKKLSNEKGQGYAIPVAKKRFTAEDDFGEVSISENDIHEIILYLNDVENYIEKRGLQKWDS